MNVKLLLVAASLIVAFSMSAQAQSAFTGNYYLLAGYYKGQANGLFGYGTATTFTSGAVSYTAYFPRLGGSGRGSGTVNSLGLFRLNNGVTGSAQMYGARVAVGTFRDAYGEGWFGIRKK